MLFSTLFCLIFALSLFGSELCNVSDDGRMGKTVEKVVFPELEGDLGLPAPLPVELQGNLSLILSFGDPKTIFEVASQYLDEIKYQGTYSSYTSPHNIACSIEARLEEKCRELIYQRLRTPVALEDRLTTLPLINNKAREMAAYCLLHDRQELEFTEDENQRAPLIAIQILTQNATNHCPATETSALCNIADRIIGKCISGDLQFSPEIKAFCLVHTNDKHLKRQFFPGIRAESIPILQEIDPSCRWVAPNQVEILDALSHNSNEFSPAILAHVDSKYLASHPEYVHCYGPIFSYKKYLEITAHMNYLDKAILYVLRWMGKKQRQHEHTV